MCSKAQSLKREWLAAIFYVVKLQVAKKSSTPSALETSAPIKKSGLRVTYTARKKQFPSNLHHLSHRWTGALNVDRVITLQPPATLGRPDWFPLNVAQNNPRGRKNAEAEIFPVASEKRPRNFVVIYNRADGEEQLKGHRISYVWRTARWNSWREIQVAKLGLGRKGIFKE